VSFRERRCLQLLIQPLPLGGAGLFGGRPPDHLRVGGAGRTEVIGRTTVIGRTHVIGRLTGAVRGAVDVTGRVPHLAWVREVLMTGGSGPDHSSRRSIRYFQPPWVLSW
jgi:hypothetical protein